jgi:hypothetical protein
MGDFNLIYKAEDNSNNRLNRRLMTSFKEALNETQLMEIDLKGRAYTWSNEQKRPNFYSHRPGIRYHGMEPFVS